MPTSSSGPLTMMARTMGQRPSRTPITGAVRYHRPTPPVRRSKEPAPQRCSVESRCSVENLVPIGSNYATWEDPQLTGDPRRLQKLAYGLMHDEIDYTMLHDRPVYYRVGDEGRRRSLPCPAPGHRERAWQTPATVGGRRHQWLSSETHGLTRTRSAPAQAAVTTPWVPQQVWRPRRNQTPQVFDREVTAATAMAQFPFELIARKAKIFRRPQSASLPQSVSQSKGASLSHDSWRSQSGRPATRSCTNICQGIRERPASALPTSRLAPRELFCPDCVTCYCDSPCEEPDPTLCYTGYGSRPYEAYGTSSLCRKPYEESGSDYLYVGQGSKPYEAPGTAPFCTGNGSKPCEESGLDQSCTGYGSRPYKDSGPAPPSSGYTKKQYGGESGRTVFFTAYSNTPCEEPDPDAMCTIDSYCDGGWTPGLYL
ncbi:hypothetical protein LSAT2_029988 [Lamellibrachia satsuma]|nr:hypothetical protein LSAT2_029988 [Lamellibrachia satsuma]